MSLIAELKRRNVFKVCAAYLALAWVVVQATGAIVPALNLPATLVPTVVWIGIMSMMLPSSGLNVHIACEILPLLKLQASRYSNPSPTTPASSPS